jgi:hypothetical protein
MNAIGTWPARIRSTASNSSAGLDIPSKLVIGSALRIVVPTLPSD